VPVQSVATFSPSFFTNRRVLRLSPMNACDRVSMDTTSGRNYHVAANWAREPCTECGAIATLNQHLSHNQITICVSELFAHGLVRFHERCWCFKHNSASCKPPTNRRSLSYIEVEAQQQAFSAEKKLHLPCTGAVQNTVCTKNSLYCTDPYTVIRLKIIAQAHSLYSDRKSSTCFAS